MTTIPTIAAAPAPPTPPPTAAPTTPPPEVQSVSPAPAPAAPANPTTAAKPPPPPKSKLKRNLIIGGVVLLVLALLVWAFIPKPMTVEVATVTQGRFERAVQDYGKTRVRDRFIVSAPLAGRVGRVLLSQGDSVALGDTVALLWPMAPALLDERTQAEQSARIGAATASLGRAQANVGSAKAAMDQAQVELKRSEALALQGFISPNQNETGRLNLRLRLSELESARQTERAARYDLEQARAARQQFAQAPLGIPSSFAVKSPVGGKVLKILQQSEAIVMAGAGLVELGDPTKLEVVVDILTEDATEVRPGAAVELINWGGTQALAGQVRRVEPAAFTKVSALGVEEQRVNVVIDITAPLAQWQTWLQGGRACAGAGGGTGGHGAGQCAVPHRLALRALCGGKRACLSQGSHGASPQWRECLGERGPECWRPGDCLPRQQAQGRGQSEGAVSSEFIHLRPRGMVATGLDLGTKVNAAGELRMTALGRRMLEAHRVNRIDLEQSGQQP